MTNTTHTAVAETLAHVAKIFRQNSNAIFAADLTPRTGDRDPDAIYLALVARLLAFAEGE